MKSLTVNTNPTVIKEALNLGVISMFPYVNKLDKNIMLTSWDFCLRCIFFYRSLQVNMYALCVRVYICLIGNWYFAFGAKPVRTRNLLGIRLVERRREMRKGVH